MGQGRGFTRTSEELLELEVEADVAVIHRKLADRGTHQSLGIVMDASSFLSELLTAVRTISAEESAPV